LRRSVARRAGKRLSWAGEQLRANGGNFSPFTAARRMLKLVHPSGGIAGSRLDWTGRWRAAALLLMLHGIELIGLFIVAGVTTRLARSHPGHGAGLPILMVLAAMALVGWQGYRLLRGRWSLNVSGLVVQSAILMAAIAVAPTQYVGLGGIGLVVACAVLAGWGRLAEVEPAVGPSPARQRHRSHRVRRYRGACILSLPGERPRSGSVEQCWRC
jgi:hypothetical protein